MSGASSDAHNGPSTHVGMAGFVDLGEGGEFWGSGGNEANLSTIRSVVAPNRAYLS